MLHAGWRGLADGVVEAGVAALGDGPQRRPSSGRRSARAATRSAPRSRRRFDADLTKDGILDLWSAAERALRRAGVERVDRVDLCTRCNPELFFSHRRSGPVRGVQGVLGAVAG